MTQPKRRPSLGDIKRQRDRADFVGRDQQIDRAVTYLREHFHDPVNLTDLAKRTGMSVRQFNRRFREVVGTTPSAYRQKFRGVAGG